MDHEKIEKLLKKYSECFGVSGNEDEIREVLYNDLINNVDQINVDILGNLIAIKKSKLNYSKHKIMITAHMDEIGLMVKNIDENGFLKFIKVGGWFNQTLLNQRVIVHGNYGNLIGVIGSKPPHVMTKEEFQIPIKDKDMFIDIGAKSKEDAIKLGVEIGSFISIDRDFKKLANQRVTSKSFDNRAGIVTLVEVMNRIKNMDLSSDIYVVGTVQEEVGLKGAKTSSTYINPDISIVIDTTIPGDHPGITKEDSTPEIGKGPVITIADASGRGIIVDRYILSIIRKVATNENIPIQLDVGDGGTTDATAIHLSNYGVHTGVISIPTRYIHSPVEVLDIGDLESCINLVVKIIEEISNSQK